VIKIHHELMHIGDVKVYVHVLKLHETKRE